MPYIEQMSSNSVCQSQEDNKHKKQIYTLLQITNEFDQWELFSECPLQLYQYMKDTKLQCQYIMQNDLMKTLKEQHFKQLLWNQIVYIKKLETVKRGLTVSSILPPISRIEYNDYKVSKQYDFCEFSRRVQLFNVMYSLIQELTQLLKKQYIKEETDSSCLPSLRFSSSYSYHQLQSIVNNEIDSILYSFQQLTCQPNDCYLLQSLDISYHCILYAFQLVFILSILYQQPDLINQIQLSSLDAFPMIPSLQQTSLNINKPISPYHIASLKQSLLNALVSTYLFVSTTSNDDLYKEKNRKLLNQHLQGISFAVQSFEPKKETKERHNQEIEAHELCNEPLKQEHHEDDSVMYIYQGISAQEPCNTDFDDWDSQNKQDGQDGHDGHDLHEVHKELMTEMKTFYETKHVPRVIVGESIDFDAPEVQSKPSIPTSTHSNINLFSFLPKSTLSYDIIEYNVLF